MELGRGRDRAGPSLVGSVEAVDVLDDVLCLQALVVVPEPGDVRLQVLATIATRDKLALSLTPEAK